MTRAQKKRDTQLIQIIVLLVLLASIAVGLMLVEQQQVFRLKADQTMTAPY